VWAKEIQIIESAPISENLLTQHVKEMQYLDFVKIPVETLFASCSHKSWSVPNGMILPSK